MSKKIEAEKTGTALMLGSFAAERLEAMQRQAGGVWDEVVPWAWTRGQAMWPDNAAAALAYSRIRLLQLCGSVPAAQDEEMLTAALNGGGN